MCDNKVDQYVPKGWSYVNRPIKCGYTLIDGSRAICDECANDRVKMRNIENQERLVAEDNATSHATGWGDW